MAPLLSGLIVVVLTLITGVDMLGELIGSLIGMKGQEERDDANREFASNNAARSEALQREFAQHGVQWRVEDAKRAGVHPVYALTGAGAAYSPSAVSVGGSDSGVDFQRMGQNFDRAVAAQETPEQKASRHLAERESLSRIKRNESEAAMFDRTRPGLPAATGMPSTMFGGGPLGSQASSIISSGIGQTAVEPAKETSPAFGDESRAAGDDRGWRLFTIDKSGSKWWLPNADSMSEAAESLGESMMMTWATIRKNLTENPYFLSENSWLIPFADDIREGAANNHELIEAVVNRFNKFRHGAADWILDRYDFSPRVYRGPTVSGKIRR